MNRVTFGGKYTIKLGNPDKSLKEVIYNLKTVAKSDKDPVEVVQGNNYDEVNIYTGQEAKDYDLLMRLVMLKSMSNPDFNDIFNDFEKSFAEGKTINLKA